jgi:hypothetical protein
LTGRHTSGKYLPKQLRPHVVFGGRSRGAASVFDPHNAFPESRRTPTEDRLTAGQRAPGHVSPRRRGVSHGAYGPAPAGEDRRRAGLRVLWRADSRGHARKQPPAFIALFVDCDALRPPTTTSNPSSCDDARAHQGQDVCRWLMVHPRLVGHCNRGMAHGCTPWSKGARSSSTSGDGASRCFRGRSTPQARAVDGRRPCGRMFGQLDDHVRRESHG